MSMSRFALLTSVVAGAAGEDAQNLRGQDPLAQLSAVKIEDAAAHPLPSMQAHEQWKAEIRKIGRKYLNLKDFISGERRLDTSDSEEDAASAIQQQVADIQPYGDGDVRTCNWDGNKDNCKFSAATSGTYPNTAQLITTDFGNLKCLNGEKYKFLVDAPVNYSKDTAGQQHLLIYFQDGGACWSQESHDYLGLCIKEIGDKEKNVHMFSRDANVNGQKLANSVRVKVHYCTGDVHAGSGNPWGHEGATNKGLDATKAVIDWLKHQDDFPATWETVTVAGSSAGALGASIHFLPIWNTYAKDRLQSGAGYRVIVDSFLAVFPQPDEQHHIKETFQMCNYLGDGQNFGGEAGMLGNKCNNLQIRAADIVAAASREIPDAHIVILQAKDDLIQIAFYLLMATLPRPFGLCLGVTSGTTMDGTFRHCDFIRDTAYFRWFSDNMIYDYYLSRPNIAIMQVSSWWHIFSHSAWDTTCTSGVKDVDECTDAWSLEGSHELEKFADYAMGDAVSYSKQFERIPCTGDDCWRQQGEGNWYGGGSWGLKCTASSVAGTPHHTVQCETPADYCNKCWHQGASWWEWWSNGSCQAHWWAQNTDCSKCDAATSCQPYKGF